MLSGWYEVVITEAGGGDPIPGIKEWLASHESHVAVIYTER